MRPRILFISPFDADANRLAAMVGPLKLNLVHSRNLRDARERLKRGRFNVVLTETSLSDGTWCDVLELARDLRPGTEVLVTDRLADARLWAEILNLGAYDLLVQPFHEQEVQRILSNACSRGHGRELMRAAV